MDRAARTGVWDADFEGGVRSFQADNGLDVDGVLLPDGPTQRSINDSLGLTEDRRMRAPAAADHVFEPMPLLRPAALTARRSNREQGIQETEPELFLAREDGKFARGYRYRADPMGRLGEGDWLDALGRPVGDAELRKIEGEGPSLARPATVENPAPFAVPFGPVSNAPRAWQTETPSQDGSLAEGGKIFARELLRVTKLEDFEDPSAYLDALDILSDETDGVEPAGWREDLRKILEAMRRRAGTIPKAPPGPPRPPAGQPPLPNGITGRLQNLPHPEVRTAANRLLDGAVVKGWVPTKLTEMAQVVKEGGAPAAWRDFAQFMTRSGGTRNEIVIKNNAFIYTTKDKSATITLYESRTQRGTTTNELRITLQSSLKENGRTVKDVSIKIRYD